MKDDKTFGILIIISIALFILFLATKIALLFGLSTAIFLGALFSHDPN